MDWLQAGLISLIFFAVWFIDSPKRVREEDGGSRRTNDSVEQFNSLWRSLWFSWLALYVIFGTRQALPDKFAEDSLAFMAINLANNFQSSALFLMFWVMRRPTFNPQSHKPEVPTPFLIAVCIVLGLVEGLLCKLPASAALKQATGIGFGMFSGVAAATCFGLFFSRLESRSLFLSNPVVVAFYFYAAIQPLFPLFRMEPLLSERIESEHLFAAQYVLKGMALVLKIALYLVVRDLLTIGRLAFFMRNTRDYHTAVTSEWEKFESELQSGR